MKPFQVICKMVLIGSLVRLISNNQMLALDSALASITVVTSDMVVIILAKMAIFYFILQKRILHSLHTF